MWIILIKSSLNMSWMSELSQKKTANLTHTIDLIWMKNVYWSEQKINIWVRIKEWMMYVTLRIKPFTPRQTLKICWQMAPGFLLEVSKQFLFPDINNNSKPYSKIILISLPVKYYSHCRINDWCQTYCVHCLSILVSDKQH
jgi:hypothetical protein